MPPRFCLAPSPIDVTFGHRLAILRTQRRLNSWQLADKLGIAREQLDRIERGEVEVDLVFLDDVSCCFDMSISDLLSGL